MLKNILIITVFLLTVLPNLSEATTVGLWLFDEGAGDTALDASGYGNHGTLGGEVSGDKPKWVPGKYGSALYFDGVNDWLNCGNDPSLDITGNLTIEFWMKPENWYRNDGTYTSIIMKGDNPAHGYNTTYDIGHANSGSHPIKFSYYNGSWIDVVDTSGVTYSDGVWYHIAVVVDTDNNYVKFYRNGSLLSQVSNDFSSNPLPSTDKRFVMGRFNNSVEWYQGALDEVRISNTALSQDELGYNRSLVPEPGVMMLLYSLTTGLFGFAGLKRKFLKR